MKIKNLVGALLFSSSVFAQFDSPQLLVDDNNLSDFMTLDLNLDGHQDILGTGAESGILNFYYYENDGQGNFSLASQVAAPSDYDHGIFEPSYWHQRKNKYSYGDLNQDGFPELLLGNKVLSFDGTSLSILNIDIPSHVPFPHELADFDGDGNSDVFSINATSNYDNAVLYALKNKGNLRFEIGDSLIIPGYTIYYLNTQRLRLFNLDNDSDLELMANMVDSWGWSRNIPIEFSGGQLVEKNQIPGAVSHYFDFCDIDGDGYTDALGSPSKNPAISYLDQNGDLIKDDYIRDKYYSRTDSVINMFAFDFDGDCEKELVYMGHYYDRVDGTDSLLLLNRNSVGSWDIAQTFALKQASSTTGIRRPFVVHHAKIYSDNHDVLVLTDQGVEIYRNQKQQSNCKAQSATSAEAIEFELFPNPATDHFTVQTKDLGAWELQLCNVLGQVQTSSVFRGSITANVSDLSPGIYFPLVVNQQTGEKKMLLQLMVK